jgi:hypothetical protein
VRGAPGFPGAPRGYEAVVVDMNNRQEERPMYIGAGTLAAIVIIVLLIWLL